MNRVVYEPFGRQTWRDPFFLYQRLRDEDPVHTSPFGFRVLSRFEHVYEAARDTATFSSAQGLSFRNEPEELKLLPTIVMTDPPAHTRIRRPAARHFTPRKVTDLEAAVRKFVVERVERLVRGEDGDFVAGLARPLPTFVVAHYLGVPERDRDRFDAWTQAFVQANAEGAPANAASAIAELYGYFTERIELRRTKPGNDLVTWLLEAADGGAEVGPDEILGFAFTMVAGGNDTTTGLLAGAAELLTARPDERRRLLAEPSLVPGAVEELLRLTSPVQGLCRVTTRDVTIDDTTIAAGERVLLCYAAANRDPREFGPNAEDLDVTRPIERLLSFSVGPHFCIGAHAARLQARVVLEELLRRCPDFTVDADAGVFADGSFVRRYESLPFRAGPERTTYSR